jgi:SAM-dependent methyltransferase
MWQAWATATYLRQLALPVFRHGIGRVCPVCGHSCHLFKAAGPTRRPDAECPKCGSRERHRFLWRYLERGLGIGLADSLLLHVAPEPFLAIRLREVFLACRYVSGDLVSPAAMVRFDLARLPLADAAVDLLICSHVLEHIPDDSAAMREIARVVSPDGMALIAVPLTNGPTQEDLSIADPAERARRYGQEDHVRLYGDDLVGRLERAGLVVSKVWPGDVLTGGEMRIYGVPDWVEAIHVCRRHD